MKKLFVFFSCIFLLSFVAAQTINIVRIENLAEQIVGESIVKRIFEKANLQLTIEAFPGLRCTDLVVLGKKDGEMMRIFNYGVKNNTLVRVPTPYYALETTVFLKKGSTVTVNTKEDLAKYKIVIVRGVQHTADITEGLANVQIVDSSDLMMKMLDAGRVDIALANKIDGLSILKKLKINTIVADKILAKHDLFIYMHPSKKDIVGQLDKAINELKVSGELSKLIIASEASFLESVK